MLNKADIKIHKAEYLDEEGLKLLWEKIKDYVKENSIQGDVDLSEYITKEMLDEALSKIDVEVDLSSYIKDTDLANTLLDYAKSNHKHSEYATESYVDSAILNAGISGEGSQIDLTAYLKKTEAETTYQPKGNYLSEHQDISGKSDVGHKHTMSDITDYEEQDLSGYALKSEIPNAYDDTEIRSLLNNKTDKGHKHSTSDITGLEDITIPDMNNYYTKDETYNKQEINTAIANASIEGTDVDLSNYVDKKTFYDAYYEIYMDEDTFGDKTRIDKGGIQLPTFDGGTILHIEPPVGMENYSTNLFAIIKRTPTAPLLIEDAIWGSGQTLTIENTRNGYLDEYYFEGVDFQGTPVPSPTVPIITKKVSLTYDHQGNIGDNVRDVYTWKEDSQGNYIMQILDLRDITGTIGIKFKGGSKVFTPYKTNSDCYTSDTPNPPVYFQDDRPSLTTSDAGKMNYLYYIISNDVQMDISGSNLKPSYTYKLWTTNIDGSQTSVKDTLVLDDINELNNNTFFRYADEKIYKMKNTDMSDYYTKEEVDEITMTEKEVNTLLTAKNYATENYVNNQISAIPSIDLTDYYTKTEVDNMIPSLNSYLKYSVVTEAPAIQEEGVLYLVIN